MSKKIIKDLDEIIGKRRIIALFQPIISLDDGEIHGYEALSRVAGTSEFANPEMLFLAAASNKRLRALDALCRDISLRSFCDQGVHKTPKRLFLNINSAVLQSDHFFQKFKSRYLDALPIDPNRIVFEITERNFIKHVDRFIASVNELKTQGIRIAIDDAGAMYSGLNLITDTRPHYVKLDRKLIANIDLGRMNFALVKGLVEFCKISDVQLIAEGVEKLSELRTLIDLGVPFAQGQLIQEPKEQLTETSPDLIKKEIAEHSKTLKMLYGQTNAGGFILNICSPTETIPPNMKIEYVLEKIKKTPNLPGFCIVENNKVIGIITRSKLMMQTSGRYGFSLYYHHPIAILMDRNFVSVDYRMPIHEVSKLAMSRNQESLYDFIVVTKEGHYLGTVTVQNLLLKATEIEVVKARYQNPLTGLPGNLIIEQKMKNLLDAKEPFCALYVDINHFKEYNDTYGFENGDLVIKMLADILILYLPPGQFVGHVGGDDFIAIINRDEIDTYCRNISDYFRTKVLAHYNEQDRARGYITAENRVGVIEQFPLITISIAGTSVSDHICLTLLELTQKLARLKKESKQQKDRPYLFVES